MAWMNVKNPTGSFSVTTICWSSCFMTGGCVDSTGTGNTTTLTRTELLLLGVPPSVARTWSQKNRKAENKNLLFTETRLLQEYHCAKLMAPTFHFQKTHGPREYTHTHIHTRKSNFVWTWDTFMSGQGSWVCWLTYKVCYVGTWVIHSVSFEVYYVRT